MSQLIVADAAEERMIAALHSTKIGKPVMVSSMPHHAGSIITTESLKQACVRL